MKALITGITGQAGKHLAELLLAKGYQVFGLQRRSSSDNTSRIHHLLDKIELIEGDLTDENSLACALRCSQPDEVYNLAAQSLVPASWALPILTADVTGMGALRLLTAIHNFNPAIKFLQVSSSEMFGTAAPPQNETTPFHPRSPYAVAKCFAHWMTINYRESYGIFASTAICFNFESFDRGTEFVTKKIISGACKIVNGQSKELRLGNLQAKRDWGYAGDTVRAMHAILHGIQPVRAGIQGTARIE